MDNFHSPSWIAQQRGDRPNKKGDRLMLNLDLSPEQKKQLAAIRNKYENRTEKLQSQLMSQQQELRTLMGGSATKEAIRKKHNQVMALRQELNSLRFEMMLDSREVLTPEQRQKFAQQVSEWGGRKRRGPAGESN
jgi:Spy/CpxP family protein refolding chaperone